MLREERDQLSQLQTDYAEMAKRIEQVEANQTPLTKGIAPHQMMMAEQKIAELEAKLRDSEREIEMMSAAAEGAQAYMAELEAQPMAKTIRDLVHAIAGEDTLTATQAIDRAKGFARRIVDREAQVRTRDLTLLDCRQSLASADKDAEAYNAEAIRARAELAKARADSAVDQERIDYLLKQVKEYSAAIEKLQIERGALQSRLSNQARYAEDARYQRMDDLDAKTGGRSVDELIETEKRLETEREGLRAETDNEIKIARGEAAEREAALEKQLAILRAQTAADQLRIAELVKLDATKPAPEATPDVLAERVYGDASWHLQGLLGHVVTVNRDSNWRWGSGTFLDVVTHLHDALAEAKRGRGVYSAAMDSKDALIKRLGDERNAAIADAEKWRAHQATIEAIAPAMGLLAVPTPPPHATERLYGTRTLKQWAGEQGPIGEVATELVDALAARDNWKRQVVEIAQQLTDAGINTQGHGQVVGAVQFLIRREKSCVERFESTGGMLQTSNREIRAQLDQALEELATERERRRQTRAILATADEQATLFARERNEARGDLEALRKGFSKLAEAKRRSADTLRSEVARGIALRQSAEEKTARAEAHALVAEQIESLIAVHEAATTSHHDDAEPRAGDGVTVIDCRGEGDLRC